MTSFSVLNINWMVDRTINITKCGSLHASIVLCLSMYTNVVRQLGLGQFNKYERGLTGQFIVYRLFYCNLVKRLKEWKRWTFVKQKWSDSTSVVLFLAEKPCLWRKFVITAPTWSVLRIVASCFCKNFWSVQC